MESIMNDIYSIYDNKLSRIMNDCSDFEDKLFFEMRDPGWNLLMRLSDLHISK